MKKSVILVLILLFFILPICIDKIFMNKFITNWSLGEWAGFLGSYLGGGISGFIALVGIWWQLNHSKKDKETTEIKNLLLETLFYLDKNLKSENLEKIQFQIQGDINHTSEEFLINEYNQIFGLWSQLLNENRDKIFKLPFYDKFATTIFKIIEFNENYKRMIIMKETLKEALKKISKKNNLFILAEKVSNLIYSYHFISNGVNGKNNIFYKEIILSVLNNLEKNDSLTTIISKIKIIEDIDFTSNLLDKKISIELIDIYILILDNLFSSYQFESETTENKGLELITYISFYKIFNGKIFEIISEISALKEEILSYSKENSINLCNSKK
ncbi:MAG: hypothetical protein ACRCZ2_12250 [Fusobacteriaceae bacterium]